MPRFAREHFIEFFRKQVAEAVHKHRMFTRDETIMVAVSGGKDSLALWDVLLEEGYRTAGLYLDLGHLRVLRRVQGQVRGVRGRAGQTLHIERVADAVGARHSPGPEGHPAPDVLGLRSCQSVT